MRSMLLNFFSFLFAASIVFGFAGTSACAEPQFDVLPDGSVLLDGHAFNSMAEYFASDPFIQGGKRCGTRHGQTGAAGSESAPYAVEDCTGSLTHIRGKYWPSQVYVIPIVFHIIQKSDGTGAVPDSRIYDQVAVLNEDYRALFGSMGGSGFDSHIQFELAGITRTTHNAWFNDQDELAYKTALGWRQQRYLNVYVNSASGYLGYSYLPHEAAGSVWDGVVLLYEACGGRNSGFPPYDQGRTLTHEVGHYLGLFHTFDGGCKTGYTAGDLIMDTNPEKVAHFDCIQTNTCRSPDPIHNYMNYTDDMCMLEFTPEQSNRAVCSLLGYRPRLPHIDGGASEKEIFIEAISLKLHIATDGTTSVRGVVTVLDRNNQVVPNAKVSIRWDGVVEGSGVKSTNAGGKALFLSPPTRSNGAVGLTVTNVYRAEMRYDSSLNALSTRSITVNLLGR